MLANNHFLKNFLKTNLIDMYYQLAERLAFFSDMTHQIKVMIYNYINQTIN